MRKNNPPQLATVSVDLEDGTTATMEVGSGNVFADLGFEDADELQFKTQLIFRVQNAIKERGLTQKDAAKMVGLDQARLSKMMRGEFNSFSSDKLFDILRRLGRRVEVRVLDDVPESQAELVLVS